MEPEDVYEEDYDDTEDAADGLPAPPAAVVPLTMEVRGTDMATLIDRVAAHVLSHADFDRHGFIKKINETISKRVEAALDATIREKAKELMEGKIAEMLQPRDEFGMPKGQPFTLMERISKEFDAYMKGGVDSNGSASSYGDKTSRVDWMIRDYATKDLKAAAEAEIKKVKTLAESQVAAAVGQFIAQNLVAPVTAALIPK